MHFNDLIVLYMRITVKIMMQTCLSYEAIMKFSLNGLKTIHPSIGQYPNFPKKRWDKMTTNLVESFNAWLKNERCHSICSFLMDYMIQLGGMLVKRKEESLNGRGPLVPKLKRRFC